MDQRSFFSSMFSDQFKNSQHRQENMACSRDAILKLYKNLIKESKKWPSYNYREFALRKIRYEFRENKVLQDPIKIKDIYVKGLQSLDVLKRQVIIGNLYKTDKLVIEMDVK